MWGKPVRPAARGALPAWHPYSGHVSSTEARLATRDLTLDLARVTCVLLVVVVHLLMAGVVVGDDGIVIERTLELQPWFPALSWLGEIMPLFFVVGGFAARVGWRSAQRRGESAIDFGRVRLARLARPALPVFAFFALVLVAATLLRVDPVLLDGVAVGVGSPLWFLAAYLLVQALAPTMIRLHERRPVATLMVLVVLAVVTDAVRLGIGVLEAGLPNVAFVWLAVQQLGFWMADGWFRERRWWTLLAIAVACYLVMLPLVPLAGYSWNMLSNQYPPTVPLLLLGLAQACLLTLLHRPLTALMRTRAARGLVLVTGSRLVTLYLWHLPVIMAVVGAQLVLPFPLSAPGSGAWWLERILVLALVLGIVFLLSLWLVRFEQVPTLAQAPATWRTVAGVLVFLIAPSLVMVLGLDVWLAVLGLVLTALALWLARVPAGPVRARG